MSSGISDYYHNLAREWRASNQYKLTIAKAGEYNRLLDEIWDMSANLMLKLTVREFMLKLTVREFMQLVNSTRCNMTRLEHSDGADSQWREEAAKADKLDDLRKLHEKLCK